ncbi:MAG TPA: hypothetical protein VJR29_04445 [bacterium]|nr:hypothetical protein [bacterium]
MKNAILALALTSLSLAPFNGAGAAEPELKFDPNVSASPAPAEKKEDFKYGEKPLAKFGNDSTYFKLGGYGSMRFSTDTAQGIHDTFTFRRFVLTTDAKIASRFRIYSELEFERFRKIELEREVIAEDGIEIAQEIEGTNQSEIAMEQVWFELEFANYIRLRGGGVLVPIGRFNINHDDNVWNLPRRPLVDRGVPVLPTTSAWDELGFGLNGDFELGEKSKLDYQIYVVNGAVLDAEVEEVLKVSNSPDERSELELEGEFGISTGTFSQDIKTAKAVTGRVAFSPVLGHEIGLSGYWGRYTPSYLPSKSLTIFGFDWLSTFGNFDIEAEYVLTHFSGLDDVLNNFAEVAGRTEAEVEDEFSPDLESVVKMKTSGLASTKQGYWVELRYHFRPDFLTKSWFGRHFSDPQLIPVVRWEQAFLSGLVQDFQAENGATTVLDKEDRFVNRLTAGLAFRLNPLAVFHTAYEFTWTNSGKPLADVTNYLPTLNDKNHSFMFGAAFGF